MFPGFVIKVNGEDDYIVFPGGAMKASPDDVRPNCWNLTFIWDSRYGQVNEFTKRWILRQLSEGINAFSTERVNDIWDTITGRGTVKKEWD